MQPNRARRLRDRETFDSVKDKERHRIGRIITRASHAAKDNILEPVIDVHLCPNAPSIALTWFVFEVLGDIELGTLVEFEHEAIDELLCAFRRNPASGEVYREERIEELVDPAAGIKTPTIRQRGMIKPATLHSFEERASRAFRDLSARGGYLM